jgi:segregation and condensation protein B
LDQNSVTAVLESLLFVANGPVSTDQLQKTLEIPPLELELAIEALSRALEGRGLRLQRKGGDVQLATAPQCAAFVERFLGLQLSSRLSAAALEALAVVAYRQPVTRAQVEAVRGVNSDGVLNTLLARGMVAEIGRLEAAGRPILYGTTFEFLQYFGLQELRQLPPVN